MDSVSQVKQTNLPSADQFRDELMGDFEMAPKPGTESIKVEYTDEQKVFATRLNTNVDKSVEQDCRALETMLASAITSEQLEKLKKGTLSSEEMAMIGQLEDVFGVTKFQGEMKIVGGDELTERVLVLNEVGE